MEVGRLQAIITADDRQFRRAMSDADAKGKATARSLSDSLSNIQIKGPNLSGAIGRAAGSLRSGVAGAFAGIGTELVSGALSTVTAGFNATIKAGLDFNKMLEGAGVVFENFAGSAEGAQKHLADLREFAKSSPFDLPDLIQASARMQAYGTDIRQVVPDLRNLQNAAALAAGTNGNFSESLDGIVTALGQMRANGRVSAEEMNQLTERGIPAWDLLAQKIGKTVAETRKLSEEGRLRGAPAADALLEAFGEGKFAGLGEKLARTTLGKESNLRDALTQQAGEAAQDTVTAYNAALDEALRRAKTPAVAGLGKAANAPVAAGLQLATDVSSGQTTLKEIGRALPQTAIDTAKELQRILSEGLSGAWKMAGELAAGAAEGAGLSMGDAAARGTKDSLQIKSPSRVYYEIGMSAAEGFNLGLEAGKKTVRGSLVDVEAMQQKLVEDLKKLRDNPQVKALLDTIAFAEGTRKRYDILFGGGSFDSFAQHPNEKVTRKFGKGMITSTAAGRYQILNRTDAGLSAKTGLTDFSPETQDLKAIALMKQRGMIGPLLAGEIEEAIKRGANEWASLPGSPYGQPTKELEALLKVYNAAVEKHAGATQSMAALLPALAMRTGPLLAAGGAPALGNVPLPGGGPMAAPVAPKDLLTLSADIAAASAALAGMTAPLKQIPPNAALATAATQTWADKIIDSSEKTKQAAERINFGQQIQDRIGQGVDDIIGALVSGSGNVKQIAVSTVSDIFSTLASQFMLKATGGGASSIGGLIGGVIGSLFGFGGFGGPKASGGPVMGGTPYLVGEQGPELFVPNAGGSIVPAGRTAQMMAAQPQQQARNYQITINVPIQAPAGTVAPQTRQQVAAQTAQALNAALQRNG